MITPTTTQKPPPRRIPWTPAAHSVPERDPRPEAGQSITLPVDGMSCAGCSEAVGSRLEELSGDIGANVSLATSKATVEYDPERVAPPELVAAIQSAGYVVPEGALEAAVAEAAGEAASAPAALSDGGVAGGAALPLDMLVLVLDHLRGSRHGLVDAAHGRSQSAAKADPMMAVLRPLAHGIKALVPALATIDPTALEIGLFG